MREEEPQVPPERPPSPQIAKHLGPAHVELRSDLEVSRHVFRGCVSYILQDPLTSQSHRIEVDDYYILTSLSSDCSLEESFVRLVDEGRMTWEDEEAFYRFVFSMHRSALLKLPVSDEETLYKRHTARLEQHRKGRLASALFYRIPIWNPDAFLCRTSHIARPLFTRTAGVLFGLLVGMALVVLLRQWSEFQRPIGDIFSGGNLPLLWITLIALKVAHEFGHAYCCRVFGGHVPEMGLYFILFTPCAFVDTTSAWGFTKKRQRLMVCLAGMYVELVIAACALLLWSVLEPGLARNALHNVVMLASVVTIGFNINPLMRYDGYYALSDLIEIPNLRARAQEYATAVLKRVVLGVPITKPWGSWRMRLWLACFGVASAAYKVLLVLGISAAIASKLLLGGLLVGGFYFGSEVVKIIRRTVPYLWYAQELALVRVRAVLLSVLLLGAVPLGVVGTPLPTSVLAPGVLMDGRTETLRAETSGFLHSVSVRPGELVEPGDEVALLDEAEKEANLKMMQARLSVADVRFGAFLTSDRLLARIEAERVSGLQSEVEHLEQDLARLRVTTHQAGRVVACLHPNEVGRFIKRGEHVATVTEGPGRVRALLTESDLATGRPRQGMPVEFRAVAFPDRSWSGVIHRIHPMGTKRLDESIVQHLDPQQFDLHPLTREANRSWFEVEVILDNERDETLPHGSTGWLRLEGRSEPAATWIYRRFLRFVDQVQG